MIEFQETSNYRDLIEIANERNGDILDKAREIAPSVHRITKLRGRAPLGRDIEDIVYDFNDFGEVHLTRGEVIEKLQVFSLAEATYYRLATNLAQNTASIYGLNDRIEDVDDVAKDAVSRVVWNNWKPEKGEDFVDLHKKVVSMLRFHLIHLWSRQHKGLPFSYFEDYVIDNAKEGINFDAGKSPNEKPIHRFRRATTRASLPSIISTIDEDRPPIEKIAALALIGYYPDGRGFTGVASEIGVKRDTLSSALDRVIESFKQPNSNNPKRPIKEIVDELLSCGAMKYPSGKNVEFDSPRIKLMNKKIFAADVSEFENNVLKMATSRDRNIFRYSIEEISNTCGCSISKTSKILNKLAATV